MKTSSIPENPRVLVIGSGAREHAIVWKLAQSVHNVQLFAAPGNDAMAQLATIVPISGTSVSSLLEFCQAEDINLVVVGPEQPLEAGLVDACIEAGIPVFGPTAAAAQLETSKTFAKNLMENAGIPTAKYRAFTDALEAIAYVEAERAPIVVKADGLAAGKGVTVAESVSEAVAAIEDALVSGRFGESGARVVVEEFMRGEEASLMFFIDANTAVPMISARDHKRLLADDKGPNTGGMGAYAPIQSFERDRIAEVVQETIVNPALQALRDQGIVYRGVLYVGLMLTEDGPKVVEFNARFGDPETEVVLPLLETDLLEIFWAVAHDELHTEQVRFSSDFAMCLVAAAEGYPEAPKKGELVTIHELAPEDGVVFHAGTKRSERGFETNGGRVVTVSVVGATPEATRARAYNALESVKFQGRQIREDIGMRWR